MSNPLYEALTGLVENCKRQAAEDRRNEALSRSEAAKAAHRMLAMREEYFARQLEAALAAAVPATPQEEGCRVCGKKAHVWSFSALGDPQRERRAYCSPQCWDVDIEREFNRHASEQLRQSGFALPAPPAVPQGWQPLNTWDYRNAPSGEGPQAAEWICREIERMRGLRYDADMNQVLPTPPSALLGGLETEKDKSKGILRADTRRVISGPPVPHRNSGD